MSGLSRLGFLLNSMNSGGMVVLLLVRLVSVMTHSSMRSLAWHVMLMSMMRLPAKLCLRDC